MTSGDTIIYSAVAAKGRCTIISRLGVHANVHRSAVGLVDKMAIPLLQTAESSYNFVCKCLLTREARF